MVSVQSKVIYLLVILALLGTALILVNPGWLNKESPSINTFQKFENYSELQDLFDSCDKNTLVTFDVDDTLISTLDVMARNFNYPLWFKLRVALKYPSLIFEKNKFEWCASIVFQQDERIVFDPHIVAIIQQLRRQKCPVVALTSMESGAFGVIKNMPEWRARMLRTFGFDFSGQFSDARFSTLPRYRGDYPILYQGILCANQQPKGVVLGAFLDYYHLKPARIISFDDQTSALDSIVQECTKRGFLCTGYQVVGAKRLPGTWNSKRAMLQLDSVMNHAQWLSDKEADAILAGKIRYI